MFKIKAPIREWQEQGLFTIVDGPSIDPRLLVDKLIQWRKLYNIEIVCADGFRLDLLKPLLEEADFEYEFLRNPGAIQSKVAPIIERWICRTKDSFSKTTNQCSGILIIPLSKKTKTETRDF